MSFMWADALLAAERAHLLRLLIWSGTSVLLGTALMAALRIRRSRSELLDRFGLQTAVWGTIEVLLALWLLRSLVIRDLAGATRLDRLLWLRIGLDGGVIMVGFALALMAWRHARRPGLLGSAMGVIVQGAGLAVLDLLLAAHISR
jgi:hypothetical protein